VADLDNREDYEEELMLLIMLLWSSDDMLFWLNSEPSIRYFTDRIRRTGITSVANRIARQQTNSFLDEIEWFDERQRLVSGLDILGERFETNLARKMAWKHQDWKDEVAIAERDGTDPPAFEDIYQDWEAKREAVTSITGLVSGAEMRGKDRLKNFYGVEIHSVWQIDLLSNYCETCLSLANTPERIWSLQFPDGPPAHENCRCTLSHLRLLSSS
jgi:hypothetical protein